MSRLRWTIATFDELDRRALYEAVALRQAVFVVEQACAYLDADGRDPEALHVLGHDDVGLRAYARLFGPGVFYEEAAIGRVVVHRAARRQGLARALMTEAIRVVRDRFGKVPIRLNAQRYLEAFYQSLGFVTVSEPYDDDGIEHVAMLLHRQR